MRKIHITEAQLECLKKRLSEVINQDVTAQIEKGETPQQISNEFSQKNPNVPKDEVQFTYNQAAMDEEVEECGAKCFTKKQIKEAKIKKLQENSVRYTKKDLK